MVTDGSSVPGREGEEASGGNLKGAGIPANRIVFSEKFGINAEF